MRHEKSKARKILRSAIIETLEARSLLAAVKIMPLGDSITEGNSSHATYRLPLWTQLVQAGYDVDFVGSMNGGGPTASFDRNNEGHSGWRADEIQANITSWANTYQPDIVLLHAGTNDIEQGQSNSGTLTEISGIIDNLRAARPNVTIILAQIIPVSTNAAMVPQLNALLPDLVSQKTTAQSPIILVDQYTGFSTSQDTYDGIHPDDSGELKMAAKWYSALASILPAPPPASGVTYLSNLNWTSATNGWGSVEKDRSNGEQGATDGGVITLDGVAYAKGLGTHAASDIRYNIPGGGYTEFRADIGVDDEAGNAGSVIFQVYVNDVLKYTSPTMTGASATQQITVPIVGGSTLRLVVTDAGNGNTSDHADWANARLLAGALPAAPAAPSLLNSTYNTGTSKVDLTWTDNASTETGFRLERRLGTNGSWTTVQTFNSTNIQSYSDAGPFTANTTYYYRVYAFNAGGDSAASNLTNITTPPAPPAPPTSYLSDLNYTVNSNGWGTAEKDRSNGEQGAADGKTITLAGTPYTKGIGVHAASQITFNLNGQYTQFLSDIGVDDEVGNTGSVIFQVYVDNVLKYTSPTLTGASSTQQISVPVTGGLSLRLVVTDAGNGNSSDHADWANARLTAGTPPAAPSAPTLLNAVYNTGTSKVDLTWTDNASSESGFRIERRLGTGGTWTPIQTFNSANVQSYSDAGPFTANTAYYYRVYAFNAGGDSAASNLSNITTPPAPPPPPQVWLSDLNWTSATNGWGAAEKDRSNGEQGSADGTTLKLGTTTYAKGLGTHAASSITYNLGGAYSQFLSDIGIDEEVGNAGSVTFQVYVDNVLKYTSPTLTGASAAVPIAVSVAGANTLRLVVNVATNGADSDHADWAGARLTIPNAIPATPVVTEPNIDGKLVDPADVVMDASSFSDSDGDTHASSDWEIRLQSTNELIWSASSMTGAERTHIQLSNGLFTGSYAGRTELVANTNYILRVRYRDSRSAVSNWGTRLFTTTDEAPVPLI